MSAAPLAAAYVTISPGSPPARWQVRVPGSKSLTNRALLLAGVASGRSTLEQGLYADDTTAMMVALRELGVEITERPAGEGRWCWEVAGLGGPPRGAHRIECGMGATVGRFLVAMLAAGHGRFRADAHRQLRRRPLQGLLTALRAQGARIEGDTFPLQIDADGLAGGTVDVDTAVSSQFLSALMLAAPCARADVRLRFGTVVSRPYLDLTLQVMRAFGAHVSTSGSVPGVSPAPGPGSAPDAGPTSVIDVARGGYRGTCYAIEPDASTASYFLASAALTSTTVRLPGLDPAATAQGDIALASILAQMGCTLRAGDGLELSGPTRLRGVSVEMRDSSDVFMTLACVAPFASTPTTIEGIGHARVKESDRIAACAENLERLGVHVEQGQDWVRIHPGSPHSATLPTHGDHRIAMAFALIGTRVPVSLEQPAVVAKTCPGFFELWRASGARIAANDHAPAW